MQPGALSLQGPSACAKRTMPGRPAWCFGVGPRQWQRVAAPSALRSGSTALPSSSSTSTSTSSRRRGVVVQAAGDDQGAEKQVKYNKEFGYSRKDVILIGAGILALGCGSYYGLQAAGVEAGMAGNFVQLFVILGISLGWVGSYLYRVATKQMTYAKQLEDYEEAVMAKRLQEMPEAEMERLLEEVESERAKRGGRK